MIWTLAGLGALTVIALCIGWLQVKDWLALAELMTEQTLVGLSGADTELEYYE